MNHEFDEIEREGKRLLTENEFENIQNYFQLRTDDFHIQHNHYFDTSDFQLKARNAALRIRYKDEAYVLTLKVQTDEGILEKHQPLAEGDWSGDNPLTQIPDGGAVQTYIEGEWGIPFHTLQYLGRLSTWRAEFSYEQGLFALDKSYYLDKVDYELEFEGHSQGHAQKVLSQVTTRVGLRESAFQPPPKIQRFFNAHIGP
ncbi:CYTH domain-containing protein [Natribacillus halophilus]|uniref:Uncharacterized protein YjbK n=1 Tax=Natribacillus halophilus TaxID=549003 RepID=A0A1G8LFW8_9BACI|nr:CYTH domain-containing protein [Natribacillus halophilus]SDI54407.1 Uncharacterized protein YjbK [Natribacillus halophilus]